MTRSILVVPCLVLATLLPSAPPASPSSRLGSPLQRDTSLATDTTPPLLTTELLTRLTQFFAAVHQHPAQLQQLATDSAHFAHVKLQNAPFPGTWPRTSPGDVAAVLDYGALAATGPMVAAAFQHAHVAPAQYLSIVKSLAFAAATDTLQIMLEGMQNDPVQVGDTTSRIWENVVFLRAHRPAIDALGFTIPTIQLRYNHGNKTHFFDTTAKSRMRLRHVTDPDDGRVQIGFLDSTEAPAGAAAGAHQPPLRVLFVGNSLTYYNAMPKLYSALAAQGLHRRVVVGLVSLPGASPFELWIATDVQQVIATLPWDYVVVQLKPTGRTTAPNFQRYARLFTQQAVAQHAQVVLWTQYPGVDTPFGPQRGLNTTVAGAAQAAGARLAPIPAAWEAIQDASYATWQTLYADDGAHPSPLGSYLISLVLYRTITGQSPIGLSHQMGADIIPDSVAGLLQRVAAGP